MAELGFTAQCNLQWGPETSEGCKVASEVEHERRNGASGATDLHKEPEKRIAPSKAVPRFNSTPSYLHGVELPENASIMARSLGARCVHLQAELLKVGNRITLCNQGHGDFVQGKQPQTDADVTEAAKSARIEVFKESLLSQRDDIMRKLADIDPGSYTAPPLRVETAEFARRLKIPHAEYPSHDFVGWLMGTAGKTRQELERRTGARVFLRYRVASAQLSAFDVLARATSILDEQGAVDYACELLQPLLDPRDPMHATASGHFLAHIMSGQRASTAGLDSAAASGQHAPAHNTSAAEAAAAAAAAVAAIPGSAGSAAASQYPHGAAAYPAGTMPTLQNDPSLPGPPPQSAGGYAAVHQTYHPPPNAGIADPQCKLFVGHLPNSMDDSMLHGLFSHYGQVHQAEVMKHRDSGLSRGFGFVHMQTREQAAGAISALNGYRMDGRILQVSVKSAKRESRSAAWSYQQPAAPSYQHHLMAPDDLPPGVDPFTLPHADVMHIYSWDSSYASGMPYIATPIGTRAAPSSAPVLNLPPAPSKGTFSQRIFAEPFSGNEIADAAGLARAAYGVWARANVEYDPSEVAPGMPRSSHAGDMSRAGSLEASLLGPNGEALDAPVQAIPVSLSAEEKKRVERREATQEARAAAEAERRQRLLAAAAAAVKQSAPPAPSKQWQKRAAVKPNDRLDSEKRPSSDAAVLRNAGSELHRQGSESLQRFDSNSRGRESAENESGNGNKRHLHSPRNSNAVDDATPKRPRSHNKVADSHNHNDREPHRKGVSGVPAYPKDNFRHTSHATHSGPDWGGSQSDGDGDAAAEPSESGEILDSDAEDTAAAGGAPVATAAASRDAPPEPSRSIATSSGGGGRGGGAVHGGGGTPVHPPSNPRSGPVLRHDYSEHGGSTPGSTRSAPGAPPMHPPTNGRPCPGPPYLDWEREHIRDRDRHPDVARGGAWKSGYGGMRGPPEYPDDRGYAPRGPPPRSPPSARGPDRLDRWERDRDTGNVRDGVSQHRDVRPSRSRHPHDLDRFEFDRFDGDRYSDPPDWPSPPHGAGPKGGYRGPPPGHPPPQYYDRMYDRRPSREGYPPKDWDRSRRGPPPGPGVPIDDPLGPPRLG